MLQTKPVFFTFADLFAGIGGIRLGFESIGGKCVYTSEWDSYAQKTYAANHHDSHQIAGDITQIDPASIPDFDVLLAGFPCQPFSIAGVSKKQSLGRPTGFQDATQGTLFFHVANILDIKRPAAFMLENVKNLLSHDKGRTFRIIMETLHEIGYTATHIVADAQNFVPQHRERTLIAGFHRDVGFTWPKEPQGKHTLSEILHRTGDVIPSDNGKYTQPDGSVLSKYTLTDKLWSYLQAYAAKHRAKGNGFGCSVVTPNDIARTLSARYYKDGSEILIYQGEGRNPRRLTPRECARLMGYDDNFIIPVSDTRAYKQFGNSVAVPVMKWAAQCMAPYIQKAMSHE